MSLDSSETRSEGLTRAQRRAAAERSADGSAGELTDESGRDGAVEPDRGDWRLGASSRRTWGAQVLAVALVGVGLGVLLGTLAASLGGGVAATAVLWLGMLVPIVWTFSRSRPAGLLRVRWIDLLWGVGLGLLLRMVQGWLAVAAGGSGALPSYPSIGGSLPSGFVFTDVVSPVVIAPVVEEFFFRAVILVSVYALLRHPVGRVMAGAVAVVVSAAVFVMLHTVSGALAVDAVVSLGMLGLVCGALVILTGRIWPAVLVHVVYNGSFVVLALAGTYLG